MSTQMNISLKSLTEGRSQHSFSASEDFFEKFGGVIVLGGKVDIEVDLLKSSTMLQAEINIDGAVLLECDRSLEIYAESVKVTHNHHFKFADEDDEIDSNLSLIKRESDTLKLDQLIYDIVVLSLPARRIAPAYRTDDYVPYVNGGQSTDNEENNQSIDPRWAALAKIKTKE